eukprot:3850613-Prymnesium_polylepis.1
MLPWLVDALTLFSAYPFEHAWRLLPTLLRVLQTIHRLLATDDLVEQSELAAGIQNARAVQIESAHAYKALAVATKKQQRERKARELMRTLEKHEWPGATQLQL